MNYRLFISISGCISLLGAFLRLVRLCMDDWPVVLKYSRWHYGLQLMFGIFWAAWAFLILYR